MIKNEIKEVLLDAPLLFDEDFFNEEEKKTVLAKGLNHYQAFSPIYKYYLILRYGVLLDTIEKMIYTSGATNFLEIGCGTGNTCIYLGKNTSINIFGIDLNEKRLSVAKKRMKWHSVTNFTFYHDNFIKFENKNCFDFIYSLAAFEAINPKIDSTNKILSICSNKCTIVLDMINPMYLGYNRKFFSENQLVYIISKFREYGFKVDIQSVVSGKR